MDDMIDFRGIHYRDNISTSNRAVFAKTRLSFLFLIMDRRWAKRIIKGVNRLI